LLSREAWKNTRPAEDLKSCNQYLEERRQQLHQGLQKVSQLLAENHLLDVQLEDGKLTITPLQADVPEEVDLWSDRLYNLLPRIHLTDLFIGQKANRPRDKRF